MLSSTDPVAVTALGRRPALPERVQVLVQAESLFKDATSLVLFKVAVGIAVAVGATVSGPAAGGSSCCSAEEGAWSAPPSAGLVWLVRRRTTDPVLETVIVLVTRTLRTCWPSPRHLGGGCRRAAQHRDLGTGDGPRHSVGGPASDPTPHPAMPPPADARRAVYVAGMEQAEQLFAAAHAGHA